MRRYGWLALAVLLASCGAPATPPARLAVAVGATATLPPTPLPSPTSPPAGVPPATSTPSPPTPSPAPAFQSGGLGASRADWERSHRPDGQSDTYDNQVFYVLFRGDRIRHLERTWGDRDAVPLDTARAAATGLIPSDARLVRTYRSRKNGNTVDLYHSESLKARLPDGDWTGGAPGDFIVVYRDTSGRVISLVIGTENNP